MVSEQPLRQRLETPRRPIYAPKTVQIAVESFFGLKSYQKSHFITFFTLYEYIVGELEKATRLLPKSCFMLVINVI